MGVVRRADRKRRGVTSEEAPGTEGVAIVRLRRAGHVFHPPPPRHRLLLCALSS